MELVSNPRRYGRKVDMDADQNIITSKRKKPYVFLRLGDDALEDATRFLTRQNAIRAYRAQAEELGRYGQALEASLHYATYRDEIAEYPDYVLSPGLRGGARCQRA